MDARFIQCEDLLEFARNLQKETWLPVFTEHKAKVRNEISYSALIPAHRIGESLSTQNWDLSLGHGMPGSVTYYGEREESSYLRFGDTDGVEPLVIHRSFHGLKAAFWEVCEEFRHFHNLYFDERNNKYVRVDDAGNDIEIIRIDEKAIHFRLPELLQFLGAKNMAFVYQFDAIRYSTKTLEELGLKEHCDVKTEDGFTFLQSIRKNDMGITKDAQTIGHILGKRVLRGLPAEKVEILGAEHEKTCEAFVIGLDKDKNKVSYTCNPDELANYFGLNPGAPNYVTPVFFRREVLQRYYAEPHKYSVKDGYLACGSLWGLRLDNNHKDHIIVLLGDLASLPHEEQLYWKAFNVPPEGSFSDVAWKRNFEAQFTEPDKADLRFKAAFEDFCQEWKGKYDWDLFRPLGEDDAHFYTALHIPVSDGQKEFDDQVLALQKVLVESMNEERLTKLVQNPPKDARSIAKLKLILEQKKVPDSDVHISFLKNMQSLRQGTPHLKGDNYRKAAEAFQMKKKPFRTVFEEILLQSISLLSFLKANIGVFSAP